VQELRTAVAASAAQIEELRARPVPIAWGGAVGWRVRLTPEY
jgi:hypothetical protein